MKQVRGFLEKPLDGYPSNNPIESAPLPIHAFFRSTSPGHQDCNLFSSPAALNSTIALNPTPKKDVFGWYLFPTYNKIAHEIWTAPDASKGGWREWFKGSNHGVSRLRFWDIWSMSIQVGFAPIFTQVLQKPEQYL